MTPKEPFMATFSEMRALICRNKINTQDLKLPKSPEKHKLFWPLVATFGETCALPSKKCIVEQSTSVPKL